MLSQDDFKRELRIAIEEERAFTVSLDDFFAERDTLNKQLVLYRVQTEEMFKAIKELEITNKNLKDECDAYANASESRGKSLEAVIEKGYKMNRRWWIVSLVLCFLIALAYFT